MTRNSNSNMRLALSYTDYPLRVACMTETWRSLPATACDDLANARGGRGHSTRTLNEPSWCWARPSTTSISASLPAPAAGHRPASRDRDDARELAGCRCGIRVLGGNGSSRPRGSFGWAAYLDVHRRRYLRAAAPSTAGTNVVGADGWSTEPGAAGELGAQGGREGAEPLMERAWARSAATGCCACDVQKTLDRAC